MELGRWQLELGGEAIATIQADSYDDPWLYGILVDSAGFERFRQYFTDEDDWPETPEFDELCAEIRQRGGFVIRELSSNKTYRLRLNQEGPTVWFRPVR